MNIQVTISDYSVRVLLFFLSEKQEKTRSKEYKHINDNNNQRKKDECKQQAEKTDRLTK